jgi:hydrogenase nickel incorporation protein HypA/HybF
MMHELSIALSILDMAAEEAERRGGVHVLAVHLRLGALSGVVKEALISAYEIAREHSALPESRLEIEEVPLRGYCPSCQADREVVAMYDLRCVECGTPTPELVSGRELEVRALEIR